MRKSYFLLLFIFFFTSSLFAQIERGNFTSGDHPRTPILEILGNKATKSVRFAPSFGYMATDNLMLGAQLAIFDVEEGNINFTQWSFSPYGRYYLDGGANSKGFFLTAGLGVGNQRNGNVQANFDNRITFYNLFVGLGKDFFIRSDLAFEGLLTYQYSNFSGEFVDRDLNSLLLDFNLQPFIGGDSGEDSADLLSKGSLLIDLQGQIFWQGQTGNDGFFNINLNPKVGIFVLDQLLVGSGVSFSVAGTQNTTRAGYGLAPFARYYAPALTDNLYAFGGAEVGFERPPGADDNIWNILFGPGLDFFITPHTALEAQLAYSYVKIGRSPALDRALIRLGLQFFLKP